MEFSRRRRELAAPVLLLFAMLAKTAFAQVDQVIYADAYQNGWQNYPWGGVTINLANTSPVHSGSDSISVDTTNYGALYLAHTAFNTSAYSNLSFWINGGATGGQLLQVEATINGNEQSIVLLPPLSANTWQQFTVDWSALGVANKSIDGIWIKEQTSVHYLFYLDDVKLTGIPPTSTAHLNANASQIVRTVDARFFGVNTATWDSYLNSASTISLLSAMGTKALRFPGGLTADDYHWTTTDPGNTSFDGFAHMATNVGAQVFTTVNYGSGTAQEAADWVRHSNVTNHYGFKYWEIGNENYGNWETDTNTRPNDAYTYALHAKDYINAMKAVDPTIKIGVPVITGEDSSFVSYTDHPATNSFTHQVHNGWTPVLLTTMKNLGVLPDFLIYHRYAQEPGQENDASLLQSSATWMNDAADLRQQLTDYVGTAGTNVELLCTENNSVSYDPGKQSTSLVNGLFMADSLGQIMQTEFNSLLWWDLRNDQEIHNNDASLYGWRQYGDYGLLNGVTNCYPTYFAGKLLKYFARGGDQIIRASSDYSLLSVYAAKRTNGSLSLLVINKSPSLVLTGSFALAAFAPATNVTSYSYGMPQDNAAQAGVGSLDIAQTNFTIAGTNFTRTFPGYSLTVISIPPSPPQLSVPAFPGNAHFQFQLNGQTGASYVIQGSTNLNSWTPLATNLLTSNNLAWVDLQNSNLASRFYRAVWVP